MATLSDFEDLFKRKHIDFAWKYVELRKVCVRDDGLVFECAIPDSMTSDMRDVVDGKREHLEELKVVSVAVGGHIIYQVNVAL